MKPRTKKIKPGDLVFVGEYGQRDSENRTMTVRAVEILSVTKKGGVQTYALHPNGSIRGGDFAERFAFIPNDVLPMARDAFECGRAKWEKVNSMEALYRTITNEYNANKERGA